MGFESLEERAVMSGTPAGVFLPTVVASVPKVDVFERVLATVDRWADPSQSRLSAFGQIPSTWNSNDLLTAIFHQSPTFAMTMVVTGVQNPLVNAPPAGLKFVSFSNGQWWSDISLEARSRLVNLPLVTRSMPGQLQLFGVNIDKATPGDWNGDGIQQLGVFRNGVWYLDTNSNNVWDALDRTSVFGSRNDIPVVGDWRGLGRQSIGVFRDGFWYLDANGNGLWDAGDLSIRFGSRGDRPIVGDWNGDGRDEIGVVRGNQWFLDSNGQVGHQLSDRQFLFGHANTSFRPVVADFDGDGRSDAGQYLNGRWLIDTGIIARGRYEPLTLPLNMGPNGSDVFPMISRGIGAYDVSRRVSLFPPYNYGYAELSSSTSAFPPLPAGVAYPTFPRPIAVWAGLAPPGRIATLPNPLYPINAQPSPMGLLPSSLTRSWTTFGTNSRVTSSNPTGGTLDAFREVGEPTAITPSRPATGSYGVIGDGLGGAWFVGPPQPAREGAMREGIIDGFWASADEGWFV
jgi:hypothetical protein